MKQFPIFNSQFFSILFLLLFLSNSVLASNLSINTDLKTIKVGEIFTATLNLDTNGESINTVEGDLVYDKNILNVEKISIGNSFVNFWIEKPDTKVPGTIHFSGITPGGVVLAKGEVFSVIFRGDAEGDVVLSLNNVNLFINDGKGTASKAKTSGINVKIAKNLDGIAQPVISKDVVIPEKFTITRTQDPSIYNDRYFIVFNSGDKGSGIDHYQVCEYWSCVDEESPYLLKFQNAFYYITVRAYDGDGNIRIARMISPYLFSLLVLFIFVFFLFFRRYLNINKV